ncbi:MAG: radical SAM protein [Ruminococcaceae bacterium]|nr:radical SAM protein [Oscillospiraceae bacterium]
MLSLEELVAIIREAKEKFGIEGVTYSGGEPTLQQNLSVLTDKIHELGLGVISFTGREFEDVKNILGNCDVILDGNYNDSRPETKRRLLGSTNQRIISLTNRYDETSLQWFFSDKKEIEINTGKAVSFNGDHF